MVFGVELFLGMQSPVITGWTQVIICLVFWLSLSFNIIGVGAIGVSLLLLFESDVFWGLRDRELERRGDRELLREGGCL